jgi:TorA maturation chaperone TorD
MLHDDERTLAARADMARLLSACFCEPTHDLVDENVFAAMTLAAGSFDPALAGHASQLATAFSAVGLEDLLVDYTRLFLGPERALAQPYGSVWMEGAQSLMQDTSLAVAALYEQHGFALEDGLADLPDHVAVELEFLYTQLFREAAARRDGDTEETSRARQARKAMLDGHLARWMPPFTAAIEAAAQTDFYRVLARVARDFTALEADRA